MNNVESLLETLKAQHEEHKATTKEIDYLLEREAEILQHLLVEYKPVYQWYHQIGFVFTHPSIKLRSTSGPILAFDDKENEVIVFNVEKGYPERVYLHDNETRKSYPLHKLVRDGHFKSAKSGILYLESMLANYVQRAQESVNKLKLELEGE